MGQMSFNKISGEADYLQLDMCSLSPIETLERYRAYNENIPVILHGDWEKKGTNSNSIAQPNRIIEYVETINGLRSECAVLGLTLHPPTRRCMSLEDFTNLKGDIEFQTKTDIFVENRSGKNFHLSKPEEVIEFSKKNKMTIDIPQLYISCKYDLITLEQLMVQINWKNVKELHLGNVKRVPPHTYVARKLTDGELDYAYLIKNFSKVEYATLEILGGVAVFEKEKTYLEEILR